MPFTCSITLVLMLKVFFQLHKNIFRVTQIDLEMHILCRTALKKKP